MSPRIKKFRKNIEARVLPYSVLILLIVAGLTSMFFVLPPHDISVRADPVTTDFLRYKKITLNSSQVPSTLYNFPVLINITDTDLRDNCLASGWDIAFFDISDNQLNHEIELWDNTTGRLVAWVNVTELAHDSDTEIYIYYGDNDIASSAEDATGTWNSNFLSVYHMKDATTSTTNDSCDNYDGTKTGANAPISTSSGKIAYAQNFDGTDDTIDFGDIHEFDGSSNLSISLWYYADTLLTTDETYNLVGKWDGTDSKNMISIILYPHATRAWVAVSNGINSRGYIDSMSEVETGVWHKITLVYDGGGATNADKTKMYIDGRQITGLTYQNAVPSTSDNNAGHFYVGKPDVDNPTYYKYWDGMIDEVRLFNTVISGDWIKTEYNTINNATDGGFFSLDSQADNYAGEYEISGLNDDTRFPFTGEAGDVVWSTGNITMAIHTNVSGTSDNCTDIFIDFGSGIDADIDEECFNITIARNVTDFTTNIYQVPNGGNITINASVWDAQSWCAGDNPFDQNGGYIVGVNRTFYVRVKVSIPASKAVGTYTTDSWNVLWKILI